MNGRVVITGIGSVSPVGLDMATAWQALREGRSGVREVSLFDPSPFPVRVAGEVPGFDPDGLLPAKETRRTDRYVLLALSAARQAADDANLPIDDPTRVGVLVGSAIGGIGTIAEQHDVLRERGWQRVMPHFLPGVLVDTASGAIAQMLGVRGPNYAPVSACSTGVHAIAEAVATVRRGEADAVLAGGVEACITPLIYAGFCSMRALGSPREGDTAASASRPFDATRNGFVCAEGATVMVVESLETALRRDASVYAEIVGAGNSNDAYHQAAPHPESRGVIEMMRQALHNAGIERERVSYINAHGTSTPAGDAAETQAIREVFGDHASALCVSSTKSATGHQFGAAGAFETAVCALAVRDQVVPPTINLRDADPACDLDYVTEGAREVAVDVALSNSMGLGGHNGCLLVARCEP